MNNSIPLIFISHSHADVQVAQAVVQLLRNALSLSPQEIRCTSVDGFRLPAGAQIDEQLRTDILSAKVFIALVSRRSISSTYVLLELGDRWGSQGSLLPLLAPAAKASILKGPLSKFNPLSCDSEEQLLQFVNDIGLALNRQINPPASYLSSIRAIQNLNPNPGKSRLSTKASAAPKTAFAASQGANTTTQPRRIPNDLSLIQRVLEKFTQMPSWLRIGAYSILLALALYATMVPRFIYGTCVIKNDAGGEDPYSEGSVGVYAESQMIFANMNDDGTWSLPLVSRIPWRPIELQFVVYDADKKMTLYPVRINFLTVLLSDRHKVYVTQIPQTHFKLSPSSLVGPIFSNAAHAQTPPAHGTYNHGPQASIPEQVISVVARIFKVQASTLTLAKDLRKDLAADSIKLSQLASALQKHFRLTIGGAAWSQISTVEDIIRYIERKQKFLSGIEAEITSALKKFHPQKGLYLVPIPTHKLNNARGAADVPKEETPLGLVDATLFGSADLAILFGRQGLYFCTSWARTGGPRRGFIDYEDFAQRTITTGSSHEVSLGNGQYFVVAGSSFEPEELIEILGSVQEITRTRLRTL